MQPTDELFHVANDRIEMKNVAGESRYAQQLAVMQKVYDAELAAVASKVVTGHGYEPYPKLLDRSLSWDQKAPLLKASRGGGSEEAGTAPKKRKKAGK